VFLLGKSEGKRPLERPNRRWEDNIKMDLQELGCFCWGNLRERDHLIDPAVDGRMILRWIFRKWGVGGIWTG
jgi:hypothetical protein